MTVQDDPYVRLPYSIVSDEVYADDQLFAWWARLKIDADGMHPSPAPLPRRIPDEIVERLVALGHIQLAGQDRFYMRAVDEDRSARSAAAKRAADARWAQHRAAKDGPDADAMRPHPSAHAPASDPTDGHEANAPEPRQAVDARASGADADAMRAHPTAHRAADASPLRSAPSDSSVASPPARPTGGGLARLADLLPPPPGHPSGRGGGRKPSDEEQLDDCRRILLDPKSPPWLVADAERRIIGLGVTRDDLLAPAGVDA